MARWTWCCALVLVGGLWTAGVASAAGQEALFTEGTLTAVDLDQGHPTITLSLSNGSPMVLKLGRFGEWNSLEVGLPVKLRYTTQAGVNTLESIQIIRPDQGTGSSLRSAVVEEPSTFSSEEKKKREIPSTEKKREKKKR